MTEYDKPPELYAGLRLHQNENTGGCSPRVLEALAAIGADEVSVYPPYSAVVAACARHFGVRDDHVALVNGLDEGILAATSALLRPAPGEPRCEAIIPQPAFEIFAFDSEVAGGRVVNVMPGAGFVFALDEVLAAITPATRIVFVTNPNNPTGVPVPREAIRAIARRLPQQAVVFLDEAYVDFSGDTFIPDLPAFPNVIVGRTFSKAYGLAGLRIGALVGDPATLDALRRVIPVYSVNIAAVVALQAALEDRAYVAGYLRQVAESKAMLYDACDRLGLEHWKSAANFVLVRVGDRVGGLIAAAAVRGVYLRDRSNEPGCAGCVRITTGIVEHTRRAVVVMEDVLRRPQ
jgi:histidinol-phosphate aminotransferase